MQIKSDFAFSVLTQVENLIKNKPLKKQDGQKLEPKLFMKKNV